MGHFPTHWRPLEGAGKRVPSENCQKVSKTFLTFCDDFWPFLGRKSPGEAWGGQGKKRKNRMHKKKVGPENYQKLLPVLVRNFCEFSEPPKRGRKTGATRKMSKSVENIFDTSWRFLTVFDVAPFRWPLLRSADKCTERIKVTQNQAKKKKQRLTFWIRRLPGGVGVCPVNPNLAN